MTNIDALAYKRVHNISTDREEILRSSLSTGSTLNVVSDKVVKYAAFMLNSVINETGDYNIESANAVIAQFDSVVAQYQLQMDKLEDVSNLQVLDDEQNLDGPATAANLAAFIDKYNLDMDEITNSYNAI